MSIAPDERAVLARRRLRPVSAADAQGRENGPGREWLTAAGERLLAERDQTYSDGDQTLSDGDRTSSGSDRPTTDRDQDAADRNQAASDHDLAAGADHQACEFSRGVRGERRQALADREALARKPADAACDALTGARTRAASLIELDCELDRCRRTGAPLAVTYVDVIGPKAINHCNGHALLKGRRRSRRRASAAIRPDHPTRRGTSFCARCAM